MDDSTTARNCCGGKRVALYPWVLHLQKPGLELKCPLCVNFFTRPKLLPCDHIFCCGCLSSEEQSVKLGIKIKDYDLLLTLQTLWAFIEAWILPSLPALSMQFLLMTVKKSPDVMLTEKRSYEDNLTDQAVATIKNGNLSCQRSPGSDVKVIFGNSMLPCKFGAENTKSSGLLRANVKSDVSHAELSSLGCPPSDSDTSVMGEEDCSDLGSHPSHFKYLEKRTLNPVSNDGVNEEGHIKNSKRQKVSSSGREVMECGIAAQADDTNISKSEVKQNSALLLSKTNPFSVGTNFSSSICTFCQTSKICEDTGEMLYLHLHNGVPVDREALTKSDVVHVHRSCAQWYLMTPQAYFVGETVTNLEKKLCRVSKLKCCKCGLKGATLGCYAQSYRRSYHLPCAAKESNRRWDYIREILCALPCTHFIKIPKQEVKVTPSHIQTTSLISSTVRHHPIFLICKPHFPEVPQKPKPSLEFPDEAKSWVLCGSTTSAQEKIHLVKFAASIGSNISKFWAPNVTHVIASTDENGAGSRTYKDAKIFEGFKFYFHVMGDLQNLVTAACGRILKSKEDMVEVVVMEMPPSTLIVNNSDS